jgi:hypothetical protein
MFKKLLMVILALALVFGMSPLGMAAQNIKITATVGELHQMNVSLLRVTAGGQTPITDLAGTGMDFGQLTKNASNYLISDAFFIVDAPVTTNHASWNIAHTATDFASGGNTLNGNVNVTFVKVNNATSDETQLSGGYVSYNTAKSKTILSTDIGNGFRLRIYYGIPNTNTGNAGGVAPIPMSQATGTYVGTVTLTLSA